MSDVLKPELVMQAEGWSEDMPEVIISHDQLADGRWRYKTSVTLYNATPEAMAQALQWADDVGRAEAERRAHVDAASGRIFGKASKTGTTE